MFAYMLLVPLVVSLFVFAYHYERNGVPLSLGELFSRAFWSVAFAFGYLVLACPVGINWFLIPYLLLTQFLAILVPHAAFQNMGRWAKVQRTWPGFFLPKLTDAQWALLPQWKRALHDYAGMAGVGFFRGLLFLPPIFIGASVWSALAAFVITIFWQPTAYLVGWYTPFKMWRNTPRSTEWGEFFIGVGWALALFAFITV